MTYSLIVDDFAGGWTSRHEARQNLENHLTKVLEPSEIAVETEPELDEEAERYARLDAKLRPGWGHDPEAQAQWVK